jgi:regulator of protease activity HflC (stomatin/prohibitin superfamily)
LNNRSVVEAAIGGNVSQTVFKVAGVEAPPEYCLILDIKFPDILVDSSLNSAIALQQNELNLIEQRVQLVQSETAQLVASIESQQVLLLESAENVAQQLVETAEAQASSIVNTARAIGIGNMFKALNITNPEEKDALLKAMAIFDNDHGNHTVMYEVLAGSLVNVN